jgi:hypothetical protein
MDSDPLFANVRTMHEFAAIRAAGMACQKRMIGRQMEGLLTVISPSRMAHLNIAGLSAVTS